jgi:hypothetical protein
MKIRKILFYGLAALLGGCVPVLSLQPLFTRQTLVFDEQLLGTWVDDANDPDITWQFSRLESGAADELPDELEELSEKVYRLNLRDEENRRGTFVAVLVKLDGQLFLDVFADEFPSGQEDIEKMPLFYNAFFFVRAHTFIKVDAAGSRLKLRLTNDDKLQKLIEADPNAVPAVAADNRIVLTASTPKLQAFVTRYADDERVFADEVVLERPRP